MSMETSIAAPTTNVTNRRNVSQDRLQWSDLDPVDIDVLSARYISPEVAQECGFHTRAGSLQIPHYDIEGDTWAMQRRPHHRRPDAPKYLFDAGVRMGLHVPPSERAKLRDLAIPIILTESALKAAAIITALRHEGLSDQYAVVSIPGVTTWRRDGGPILDFEDFPSRASKRGNITYRRPIIIAHDSNANTNPNVIIARWKLTDYLRRVRKHDVRWIDVPEGPGDTQKARERGIDDVLSEGIATMPEMLQGAYTAPDAMPVIGDPEIVPDGETLAEKVERQDAIIAMQARHISELTTLALSPNFTESEKTVLIRAAVLSVSKYADGDTDEVRMEISDIANDYRPAKKDHPDYEKYRRSPLNPKGDQWFMKRSSVSTTTKTLTKKLDGIVNIRSEWYYVREKGKSQPDRKSDVVIERPGNIVDFLEKVNQYRPAGLPDRPYNAQKPCPDCEEVHTRTRTTSCDGCGAILSKDTINLPPANMPIDDLTDDQRDDLDHAVNPVNRNNRFTEADQDNSPAPAPLTIYNDNIVLRDGSKENAPVCDSPWGCDNPADVSLGAGTRCREHSLAMEETA